MNAHDSFDWTNAGVGGFGLLLTLVAIWQATGAKKAATEAREAVLRREVSFVIAEIVSLTLDLADHIDADRLEAARVRSRDISTRISREQARFRVFLGADFGQMLEIEKRFITIAEEIPRLGASNRKRAVANLVNRVDEANRMLNSIYGRLQSGLDREGQ